MGSIVEISIRATIGFCVLLFLTRILGKKQMGQLTIFTYNCFREYRGKHGRRQGYFNN